MYSAIFNLLLRALFEYIVMIKAINETTTSTKPLR